METTFDGTTEQARATGRRLKNDLSEGVNDIKAAASSEIKNLIADVEDLAAEDISRVLAVADAKIFHKSFCDQSGELWSPSGRLLATTTQIGYFKA